MPEEEKKDLNKPEVKVGDRIGMLFHANNVTKIVELLGYGILEGYSVPSKEAVGFMADTSRRKNVANPVLKLDDGTRIYGCEGWWAEEKEIKDKIDILQRTGYTIKQVTIEWARKKYKRRERKGHLTIPELKQNPI